MTTPPLDPFDFAVAEVKGDAPADAPAENSNGAPPLNSPPPRSSRRGGTRPGAGRPRKTPGSNSAHVHDAPAPETRPDIQPIDPAIVGQLIRQLDGLVVAFARTTPISKDEAQEGGQAFGPVLDHYMPQLAGEGGMWVAPALWVVCTYGPRALERAERLNSKRASIDAAPAPATDGGAPGETVDRFSERAEAENLRMGYVVPLAS